MIDTKFWYKTLKSNESVTLKSLHFPVSQIFPIQDTQDSMKFWAKRYHIFWKIVFIGTKDLSQISIFLKFSTKTVLKGVPNWIHTLLGIFQVTNFNIKVIYFYCFNCPGGIYFRKNDKTKSKAFVAVALLLTSCVTLCLSPTGLFPAVAWWCCYAPPRHVRDSTGQYTTLHGSAMVLRHGYSYALLLLLLS